MLKITFFQYTPIYNELEKNLSNITNLLKDNKLQIDSSDLVVFPEYCFSGPLSLKDLPIYTHQLEACNLKLCLAKLSLKYPKTAFVFGTAILPNNELKNTSLVYLNGKLLAEYSKKALIYNENYICKTDSNYPIVKVKNIRIGIAICWDLILPEVFRKYVGKADLIVVPSFWGIGGNLLQAQYKFSLEKKYYQSLCIARAYENSINLLFVNSVGIYSSPHYKDRMMGGSLVITPPEGITYLSRNKKPEAPCMLELNFDPLTKFRKYYATDKDFEYYKSKDIF